ncbi:MULTISPECIES: LysR family transcriptional regulator [Burkholderia]|jgi:DNA-binding transcriptional LysR family regulator|uniref:Bacterial regulatory helix-turn-helix, lysR family protein n=1 Tax=Burkholderia gladioli TaxID=28095 RepID=A0AAW7R6Y9_BURGA|nr:MULTISPECIES: LysR family transcriptional regulator [Burkholderia]AJW99855.1 bacterial regulatory helix-turn-helix, lysR family protein [Burkholderia gladioli]ASD81022.1 LysR family transcriptional regulator [Burkholderia gladioli pv. gladioli]AWY53744.1 LysR family transcriptional regulator [Burkholderia gladioli pv. gladioli]KAF1063357.1 HTH-type transcriptional regulator DmlR [Burkholderia gladioli]KGC16890.1 bacterial regulatory helix-turn-helix, lysR family protein [Burkholderia gladio
MDTLVSMNVFRYVVEVGSFVGAAERMQMSAAMASKHVMHLEQTLGARLLHRTTRRVAPTEAGREYYERLVQALTELDEAGQAVGAASIVPQGRLRVTSLSAFGLRHVMNAVTDYAARYADVTVEITLSDRVVELIDEGYDVAVRAAPFGLKSSSLVARQIATAHILLVASPAYLEEHGTPATLADLEQHNYLRRDAGSSSIDAQAFDSRVTLSGNLIVNHLEALRVAVLSGSGIAMLGTEVVGDDIEAGRLVPLLLDLMPPRELPIYAVYASRRHVSAKVRSFVDFLADRFSGQALCPSIDAWVKEAAAPKVKRLAMR